MYGVPTQGLMFGNKRFDVDNAANIYRRTICWSNELTTPGLYELIFKKIPDDLLYTEDDMNKYKSILATNTSINHRADY